jgi:glutamate synthase (ferredoxin)
MKDQGLYLSEFERDNCGAGFICNLKGQKSNQIIHDALEILIKLEHRGAVSSDGRTGDGAGILIDIPHEFFSRVCDFELPIAWRVCCWAGFFTLRNLIKVVIVKMFLRKN